MSEHLYWNEIYKTGVEKIDRQHRKLFDLFERLRQSLKFGLNNPIVGATIKDLVEYTQEHFADEEEIQKQINFEEYKRHQKLHRDLLNEMAQILLKLKNNEQFNAMDLLNFLKHWIQDHILKEDLKIGEAYKKTVDSAASINN
ncbi:MAG: hypothetical protein DWP97_05745 [Calditrichaeota bacterium]|nr:MAG: hypothetical protein DWP97_05745 [Calditrichota bacterium]